MYHAEMREMRRLRIMAHAYGAVQRATPACVASTFARVLELMSRRRRRSVHVLLKVMHWVHQSISRSMLSSILLFRIMRDCEACSLNL